jgi:PTH1 family peptidyl-tRNA hydrolase
MWSILRLLGFGKRSEQQATDNMIKYLVVGLGNIGPEYRKTRHNMGFMVVDRFAEKNNAPAWEDRRYGFVNRVTIKGRQIVLLKPSTFMNLSGNAVRYWMKEENIALENLLVVVDDLALPVGELRLKPKGSDAGHNGLKHIADILGTQAYARLRFGIGNEFPRGGQVDFVLGEFDEEDQKILPERIDVACEMIKSFCLAGINITMNQFNKK